VNNNVIYDKHVNQKVALEDIFDAMSLETVHYLIIERGAVNITTGGLSEYSLAGSVRGNFAFWPKAFDSMANSLYGKVNPGV
jgi:hypothetical protein